jgi:Predicted transmembrane transcriptional regulator (anti-sigma factor)
MITNENYQAYLLDYIEGELSPKERKEVESFLEQNPQKAQEMKAYDAAFVLPQTTVFVYDGKEKLKHKPIALWRKSAYIVSSVAAIGLIVLVISIFISKPQVKEQNSHSLAKTQPIKSQVQKVEVLPSQSFKMTFKTKNPINSIATNQTGNTLKNANTQTTIKPSLPLKDTVKTIVLQRQEASLATLSPRADTLNNYNHNQDPIIFTEPSQEVQTTPCTTTTIIKDEKPSLFDKLIAFFHLRDKVRQTNIDIQFAKEEFIYRSQKKAQQIYYAFTDRNNKHE